MSDTTIGELVTKLYEAASKMGKKNPHRALMLQAVSALLQQGPPLSAKDAPRVQLVSLQ